MIVVNTSKNIQHVSVRLELKLVERGYEDYCKHNGVDISSQNEIYNALTKDIPQFLLAHDFQPDFPSMFMTCDKIYINQIISIINANPLFQYEDQQKHCLLTNSLKFYLLYLSSDFDPRSYGYKSKNEDETINKEGRLNETKVLRRQRNRKARQQCLEASGYTCYTCGFNFEKMYGELGKGFLEVHHKVPLSSYPEEHVIPQDELCALCSNCHSMVHRYKNITLPIEDLRKEIIARGMFHGTIN